MCPAPRQHDSACLASDDEIRAPNYGRMATLLVDCTAGNALQRALRRPRFTLLGRFDERAVLVSAPRNRVSCCSIEWSACASSVLLFAYFSIM